MKTSVEVDGKKVKLAKELTRTETLRELIDKALDELIERSRQIQMMELLGTNFFEGSLAKMRGRDKSGRSR